MKCPMSIAYYKLSERDHGFSILDCLQAECAWWEPWYGMCCKRVPAYELAREARERERRAEHDNRS